MLQPNSANKIFHATARAKAKMYEFNVPEDRHINLRDITLTDLLDLTVGMLGSLAAGTATGTRGEEKYGLTFSAQYFLALLEAKATDKKIDLIRIMAASGFFLADYPGSCSVILSDVNIETLSETEKILLSILRREPFELSDTYPHREAARAFQAAWRIFMQGAGSQILLEEATSTFRKDVYESGGDEDLLLVDLIRSIALKRFSISAKNVLGMYSGSTVQTWTPYFRRNDSIQEFWPSQMRLAEKGVFGGTSAIVQMPTSAGKTKSAEFIVRSCFLSDRGSLAVIVAPYRALCQEIYNDFRKSFSSDQNVQVGLVSDVYENDLEIDLGNRPKSILILTPEKLDFLLRFNNDLAGRINLIIYDEGHLFDDESRGVKYELLLGSLKQKLPTEAQVVLISAVISNAQEIKEWLFDDTGSLIDGKDLNPTSRNIAFVDWSQTNRFLQFVEEANTSQSLFFVPTVLQSHELEMRGQERTRRFYPMLDRATGSYQPTQVAGFLGARLSEGGLSAVFTGRKDSAQKIASELIDAYGRGLPLTRPSTYGENQTELQKTIEYIRRTLGEDSLSSRAADLGVLLHHGNIPHGLRLVTEYALQNNHFKMVICTSTLAQGVNLPIRYLVVSSERQGRNPIKTRDFHNLMGRAGRSGKYTEGTVIFADPRIYRARFYGNRARWNDVNDLLNPEKSEPSKSRLLNLLKDTGTLSEEDKVAHEVDTQEIKKEISSYLINALAEVEDVNVMEQIVSNLARNTLGYTQISEDAEKSRLISIFIEIGREILTRIPNSAERPFFARSILNLEESQEVLNLISENETRILEPESDILRILWPILYRFCANSSLRRFSEADSLTLCQSWMEGSTFTEILTTAETMERVPATALNVNQIVELCESAFSYGVATLLGSLTELMSLRIESEEMPRIMLETLKIQKRIKYGLPNMVQVNIYELGLSDRRLCAEIAERLDAEDDTLSKRQISALIALDPSTRAWVETNYPAYFGYRLEYLPD